jgi:N-acetylneuraminate synthase
MNGVFVIAEAGVNHNGSVSQALRLVDVAADAGADAVKFQTFSADKLASRHAPKADYQLRTTDSSESQVDMLRKLELSKGAHHVLLNRCRERGIEFMSTSFDLDSLKFLVEEIGIRRIKMPSGEITNGPLLLQAARSGKPIILSTGMSTLEEIGEALAVLSFGYTNPSETPSHAGFREAYDSANGRRVLADRVTVLHCVTEYPAPLEDVNLRAIPVIRESFATAVGYSDHTLGISAALAAVAIGSTVIEKHFTLDKTLPGPDHGASLEPNELESLIKGIREITVALGDARKEPTPAELRNRVVARKSLVAARAIHLGDRYAPDNLTTKRPGGGMSPMRYWELMGRSVSREYREDEPIE